jgi:glycosyltransferase involved in cell wall biosynthesis
MNTNVMPRIENAVKLPKLIVVSSYHRACGIAQYVEFLELPLLEQHHFHVEIAALPVDLLRAQSPYARKAAQTEYRKILQRVESADIVNIQLEPGLLGFTPHQIWRNLYALIRRAKKIIITYHTVPPLEAPRLQFDRRGLIDYLRGWRGNYVFNRLFAKVRKNPTKFHHIVQTAREARNFALLGVPEETITHQPLAFISKDIRQQMDHEAAKTRVLAHMQIEAETFLVGCFGFLSPYKGIEVALKAMETLPKRYRLLIVGGLHPEGISIGNVDQPYIKNLLEIIKARPKLKNRIHFCGALDNEGFSEVMLACDAVVLPYAEVGQTSSGPAALALDMGRPLYCSHTKCFSELAKYQPDAICFFEVGNHMELAEKLVRRDGERPERVKARSQYLEKFSVEHRAASYIAAAERLMGAR